MRSQSAYAAFARGHDDKNWKGLQIEVNGKTLKLKYGLGQIVAIQWDDIPNSRSVTNTTLFRNPGKDQQLVWIGAKLSGLKVMSG